MNWSNETVLVTGAGGFIGSHLAEMLATLGARTRALVRYSSTGSAGWLEGTASRTGIQIVYGDVRDPDSLRSAFAGVNVVFHLAALIGIPYSYEAPLSYVRTNVEGTLNVLQAASAAGAKRVIHTSTSEVYGNAPEFPITERTALRGQSPYAASKIGADQLAYSYFCSFGTPVTILRPFNTFGPRQSARAVIPSIISQALTRSEIRLGSLSPRRDLTFVADTCEGFIRAAESDEAVGQTIQLGTGRDISVEDLAKSICHLLGKELPIRTEEGRVRPAQSEIDRLISSPERAKELLGWSPKYSLETGLEECIRWVRENLGSYRPDTYAV